MRRGEGESHWAVPVVDVDDPGEEEEQRAANQRDEAQPLQRMECAGDRWPLQQFGPHHPEFGEQERDSGNAGEDMQPFVDAIQIGRVSGEVKPPRGVLG